MIPWAHSSPYSIGSSVAAQLTLTTDRQTDGPRDVLLMQKDGGLLLAHHVYVNKHEKEITVTSDQNTNVCLNSTCFAIYFQKYPDMIGVWSAWAHYTPRYASVRPTEKVYHYHCVTTDRTLSGLTARDRCLGPLSPYRIGSSVAAQLTLATDR